MSAVGLARCWLVVDKGSKYADGGCVHGNRIRVAVRIGFWPNGPEDLELTLFAHVRVQHVNSITQS